MKRITKLVKLLEAEGIDPETSKKLAILIDKAEPDRVHYALRQFFGFG